MLEIKGDIWSHFDNNKNSYILITTNAMLNSQGELVMGKGLALDAKKRWPELPGRLGQQVQLQGNFPIVIQQVRMITFPTKSDWRFKSELKLIERSLLYFLIKVLMLDKIAEETKIEKPTFYFPRPGCGNGGLDWKDVKSLMEKYLREDRFVVVNNET